MESDIYEYFNVQKFLIIILTACIIENRNNFKFFILNLNPITEISFFLRND